LSLRALGDVPARMGYGPLFQRVLIMRAHDSICTALFGLAFTLVQTSPGPLLARPQGTLGSSKNLGGEGDFGGEARFFGENVG